MSEKNITHLSDIIGRQSDRRSRNSLLVIGLLLVLGLVFSLIMMLPKTKPVAEVDSVVVIPYSHALEMQYAQPWLDKPQAASVIEYSDALAMQYAQPWLNKPQVVEVQYGNALAMQYTQPWLDKAQVVDVQYSNALAMQYAQPWLDKQHVVPTTFTYNNYLELFYAQPWLEKQESGSCNGRLDLMYACQYGNWSSQK